MDTETAIQAAPEAAPPDTRQRILDVALDLFIEKGYDKTSLREIADQLGLTKAALYYHFPSKKDILLAQHYRFHDLFEVAIGQLGGIGPDPASWPAIFDYLIAKMLANRKLFLMHERNRAAFEEIHRGEGHAEKHFDLESQFRRIAADPSIDLRDRLRFTCAQGVLIGGLLSSGSTFTDVSTDELTTLLKEALHDVLGQSSPS